MARRGYSLLAGWLLLSVLLVTVLFGAGRWFVETQVRERLGEHLLLTLEESLFSNTEGRVNDRDALLALGRQIDVALADVVAGRWYAAQRDCSVRLLRIDDVAIDETGAAETTTVTFPRNRIDRVAGVGIACSPGWAGAVAVAGLLGACFLALYCWLPPPLSGAHRGWIEYLLERGYGEAEAFDIVGRYDARALALTPAQQGLLERLHDAGARNFDGALRTVTDARVAQLDAEGAEWVWLGLQRSPGDLPGALALARAGDSLDIDLDRMTLAVRGLPVDMSRTPLFYLAWYAMKRLEGDGWITNPASNRPDVESAGTLIELMSRHDGHGRAINDLQQDGLKARTLDQNRSKIKEDLVEALGESLAGRYLFEASKHPDGVRMRYRLALAADNIHVTT